MAEPIVYVDRSKVREGRHAAVESAVKALCALAEAQEPRLLSYGFYLEGDDMTVVAVHPDSASLELHMDVVAPAFGDFAELIRLTSIEVFGKVSERAVERLRAKARALGNAEVRLHERLAAFGRTTP